MKLLHEQKHGILDTKALNHQEVDLLGNANAILRVQAANKSPTILRMAQQRAQLLFSHNFIPHEGMGSFDFIPPLPSRASDGVASSGVCRITPMALSVASTGHPFLPCKEVVQHAAC